MYLYCTQGFCCFILYVGSFNDPFKLSHVPFVDSKHKQCILNGCFYSSLDYNLHCILVGNPVSTSCPIEMSPQRAVVGIGDPFTATCNSSTDRVAEMGWESSNGVAPLTRGVTSLSLNIMKVTDYGLVPQCYINFIDGTQCSHELPVTVYSKLPLTLYEINRQSSFSF